MLPHKIKPTKTPRKQLRKQCRSNSLKSEVCYLHYGFLVKRKSSLGEFNLGLVGKFKDRFFVLGAKITYNERTLNN